MEEENRIYKELVSEDASVWFISDKFGKKLLIKLHSTTIKEIIKGTEIYLQFGKDRVEYTTYLHTGIRVLDDPVHYLSVTGVERYKENQKAILELITENEIYTEFFNELDTPLCNCMVNISDDDKKKLIEFLGDIDQFYTGDFDAKAQESLDAFEYTLYKEENRKIKRIIDSLLIRISPLKFQILNLHFIGLHENHSIKIDTPNEGDLLEKLIWSSLESVFNSSIYKSPKIIRNKKSRELIDILCFSEYGIFLIESKALAITTLDKEKNIVKRIEGIQKQIKKALKQLIGAKKVIQENTPIYDSKGNVIIFRRDIIPHCIVLVSNIYPFGDWNDIIKDSFEKIIKEKVCINIMDLSELLRMLKICRGDFIKFDYSLMERTKAFIEHKTLFLKVDEK